MHEANGISKAKRVLGRWAGLHTEGLRAGEHGALSAEDPEDSRAGLSIEQRAWTATGGGGNCCLLECMATGGLPGQANWHLGVLSPSYKHSGGASGRPGPL